MKGHEMEGLANFAWSKTMNFVRITGLCSQEVILKGFVVDHVIAMEYNKNTILSRT